MAKLSTGGFIVLPGGFGTFEELMEMITWNQVWDRTPGSALRGVWMFELARAALTTDWYARASCDRSQR